MYAWDVDRTIVRFPDPAVEIVDERFRSLVVGHEVVERLWTGGRWLEGPVWFGDGRYLLFSDIPNNRMMRWLESTGEVTPYRVPSDNSNGNTRDRQGRLVTCEHLHRRVTRTEHDGTITVLMDGFEGKRLNAPNDVIVAADDSIWFSDPGWGILGHYEGDKGVEEIPQYVFRIDPSTGAGEPVIAGMNRPNGLCFSPGESVLYVVAVGEIRAFDMVGGRPVNGRLLRRHGPGRHRRHPLRPRRQHLGGGAGRRSGIRRRALLPPGGRAARAHPPAGDRGQPVLRRHQEEPAVRHGRPVPLQRLRRGAGRPDALTDQALNLP